MCVCLRRWGLPCLNGVERPSQEDRVKTLKIRCVLNVSFYASHITQKKKKEKKNAHRRVIPGVEAPRRGCHGTLVNSPLVFPPPSDGLAAFRAFLRTEFSEENLEFWLACEEYKKIKSQSKMASKAKKIFAEYIAIQSCKEVSGNISEMSCTALPPLLFLWLTSPGYLSTGEPGFLYQRSHQGQPAECDALLLRPSAEADIRADGKGLISPLPALGTLLGLNQPKKAQLHLNLILIIKDQNKKKNQNTDDG